MLTLDGIIFSLQRYGGISVYFHELVRSLAALNIKTDLLIDGISLQNIEAPQPAISVHSRNSRILERYRDCSVLDSTSIFHSSYYRRPNRVETPMVLTVYDFVYERYIKGIRSRMHTYQKNNAIKRANAVICISESTRQDMLHYIGEIPGQLVQVIHCGVSNEFIPTEKDANVNPYILFVGQRSGYKNFELILRAMTYLPELKLYCVGGGPLLDGELSVVSQNVRQRVLHIGYVDNKALNVLYNNALCLVYPSKYEGFGIPVIEAMRAGCPVVSSACSAVMEVGGGALIVVDGDDPKVMAQGVERALGSDRSHLIEKGFSIAANYSWEMTHKKTIDVYQNLRVQHG